MVTWKFENIDVTFKSQPEKLERDISKMAYANNLSSKTKVIIIDGITPESFSAGDGDTTAPAQPTVSKSAKRSKTESQTTELRTVSGDVDQSGSASDDLEYLTGEFDPDGSGDRLAL